MTDTIDPEKLEEAIAYYEMKQAMGEMHKVIMDAARAHLATLPRSKEIKVWRVEWAEQYREWEPKCAVFQTEPSAEALACALRGEGHRCITVTGPHKQRVPA